MRPATRAAIALGLTALVAAACTVPTTPPTTTGTTTTAPGSPAITSFFARAATTAPTVVTYGWTVSDPTNDPLTCSIDMDGNGTTDLTVADCAGTASRNLMVTTTGSMSARLSVSDATNTVTATAALSVGAGPAETYSIVTRASVALPPELTAALAAATARWHTVVTRGVPDWFVNVAAGVCGTGSAAFSGSVDDLVVNVDVRAIDGPGGVLGGAGPCVLAAADGLPRLGMMTLDSADVAPLAASGGLAPVVLHELGHVLGIGSLWSARGLIQGAGTPDPVFTGPAAVAEWSTLGRTGRPPLQAGGPAGTALGHWDESTFRNELMTGYLDPGADPLSALTIASLADLGYHVDLGAADAYQLPSFVMRAAATPTGSQPTL